MNIFVGGWAGSGSRVLQQILERAGYFVGEFNKTRNECYDYLGRMSPGTEEGLVWSDLEYMRHIHWWYKYRDNAESFKNMFLNSVGEYKNWSLKHGTMMFIIDDLKRWFPQSKFILTVRHPIDNLLKGSYAPWVRYHNMIDGLTLKEQLNYYGRVHRTALSYTDFVFKLEDFCYFPKENIEKLFSFLEIDDDPNKYLDIIKVPDSIGRRGNIKLDHEILSILGYRP